nr:class I SAM-dependent methyltransferase [Prochlorococcus sp. MIT 1223]
MNSKEWEDSYSSNSFSNKNEYPSEEIVSFIMRRFSDVKDFSNIECLDLGCGWGNNLRFLKDKGFSYSGVDFSKTAINHCKLNHKNVYCNSVEDMPFPNESFDVAFDRMCIQHNELSKIPKIFSEVHRVLKSSGVFFSILVEKANYNYTTSYLSRDQIEEISSIFSSINLDYIERSYEGGHHIVRANILTAIK